MKRAIWVTRWDYDSADGVRTAIQRCAEAGFDTVLFQVRGNGTVFYPSKLEPWAEEFDHRDPGYDPLAVACDAARSRGVALHAWINAVPGWRGIAPPRIPDQLYHIHPEWFLYDQEGRRQPLQKDYYVALNPARDDVRKHVASICAEVAREYPVAGIHLDYIRFLEPKKGHSYPRDPDSLARYQAETGREIGDQPDEKLPREQLEPWQSWKTQQITNLVDLIREHVRRARPDILLTAAVFRTPEIALSVGHQDWTRWLEDGLVDAVYPMQYDDDDERFATRVRICREAVPDHRVIMGIGVYMHEDPDQTLRQLEIARRVGCDGTCLFAYSSFWRSPADRNDEKPPSEALRRSRRESVLATRPR